jgi:2-methylcitrate dehydratase
MDDALRSLVEYVRSAPDRELPPAVLQRCRDIVVDTLGCAVGGRDSAAATAAESYPVLAGGAGGGVVLGRRGPVPVDLAAFWNTAMIRHLDYSDTYPGGHPSDMIGALIALSGVTKVSGRQFLTAVVVAYEVFSRVAGAVLMRQPRTLDQGYAVALGATAGACTMVGAPADTVQHALSLAACGGVPLRASRAGELSDLKGAATAFSTRDAVFYLHLAQHGMTAPPAPFEGRHGIVELLTGSAGPLALEPFEGRWNILRTRLKYWPVAYNMQAAVWAALQLRERVDHRLLDAVIVYTDSFSWHESGSEPEKWDPRTSGTADHSLPYVVAKVLSEGRLDRSSFALSAVRDPAIRPVMAKVSVSPDPDIDACWPAVMSVRAEAVDTAGGRHVVTVSHPRGHDRNPMSSDEISAKFRVLVEPLLGDRTETALRLAWDTLSGDAPFSAVTEAFLPG